MDRVDIKAGTALIRILRVRFGAKDTIFNGIETHIEKRARVGARAQVSAEAQAAFRKQITAESDISRASERQIVSFGNSETLCARGAEGRRQEAGLTIGVLEGQRSIRQINYRYSFDAKSRRRELYPIARFDRGSPGVKTPLGNFFIARGDLAVDYDDRIETDFLNAISGEIHSRTVLCLIGIAGRVDKEAGLGFVIPFRAAASDALLIALIKDYVTFGDHFVGRLINRNLVSLQAIGANARIDIAFVNFDDRAFGSRHSLGGGIDNQRITGLYR